MNDGRLADFGCGYQKETEELAGGGPRGTDGRLTTCQNFENSTQACSAELIVNPVELPT